MNWPERKSPPSGNAAGRDSKARAISNSVGDNHNPIRELLSRLDKVRHAGESQWVACCPAHDDNTPSLAVRETGDGTLLLHCFAGCPAAEIVAAAGLAMRDLFPDTGGDHRRPIPKAKRWDYRGLIRALGYETTIVVLCANDLANNRPLAEPDRQRLMQAARRIERVREVA